MKTKPFILAFALAGTSLIAFAQKGEISSAKKNYEQYVALQGANSATLGMNNLQTAKKSIDKAVVNAKTAIDPAAWAYKALIYADMAIADTAAETSKPIYMEALAAYNKAGQLDTKGQNKTDLDRASGLLGQYEFNRAVRYYQANKFDEAYNSFNSSLNYRKDTTTLYYAGLSAISAKNYKGGIEKYEALTKTTFSVNPQIYLDLSRLYTIQGDTTAALRVASEGNAKFNNSALATQEIELSLMSGKQKEVIDKISAQAAKEPANKLYAFYLGIAYSAANDNTKAEEAYKKALQIDPEFVEANINLGGLILNRGIDTYNKANKLPQNKQKEYDEMMRTANAQFDAALPYLSKSADLNPKSKMALENLRTYHIIKRNQAKVDEINIQLKGL